jgi:hypothetical protein
MAKELSMELTIEQALQQGVAVHKEGKFEEAERLYRAILQSQPLHPDANHNLGVIAVSFELLHQSLCKQAFLLLLSFSAVVLSPFTCISPKLLSNYTQLTTQHFQVHHL